MPYIDLTWLEFTNNIDLVAQLFELCLVVYLLQKGGS